MKAITKPQFEFLNSLQPDAGRWILEQEGRCEQTLILARYAAGLLSRKDTARTREHIANCSDCAETMTAHVKNQRRVRPPRLSVPDGEAADRAIDAERDRP